MLKNKFVWDAGLLVVRKGLKERPPQTAIPYLAGGFRLSKEPDGVCRRRKRRQMKPKSIY